MPKEIEKDNSISECCEPFIKRFHVNKLLRMSNATKDKGYSAYDIFAFLLGLVFTGKNFYTLINHYRDKVTFGKDVVYRFLKKTNINWEAFLPNLSCGVVKEIDKLTSDDRKSVLIIDDSPYYRNRSKKVEFLSRCYNHITRKYYKGLTMLTVGWSDGQTFVPVSFRLLGSGNDKNLLEGSHTKEDNRTIATKRRNEARTSKPTAALSMLYAIKGTEAQTKYVVFDSWFSSPSFILSVNGMGYDVVTRLKDTDKHHYVYNNENVPISKIYGMNRKRRGKSKYLLSAPVEIRHKDFMETIPATIVFIRDRSNRKKWIALITTDLTLSEEEIIALYGKRWDIEPFHKMLKSYLRLEDEFMLRSYDAMTAHATIVMTRYVFLAVVNRESKDFRSVNEGFHALCKELDDISFSQAFEMILNIFKDCLNDWFIITKQHIDELIDHFIRCLPIHIKDKLVFSMCES